MAWTAAFPASTGDAYSDDVFLDNVDQAMMERGNSLGITIAGYGPAVAIAPRFHSAGDVLQSAGSISVPQALIEGICVYFAKPTINFAGDLAPVSVLDWHWDLAGLWSAASVNAAGWYAEYPREGIPAIGTAYADGSTAANGDRSLYNGQVWELTAGTWAVLGNVGVYKPDLRTDTRRCAAGDYLNSTTFNEIYDAFNLMIWTGYAAQYNTPPAGGPGISFGGSGSGIVFVITSNIVASSSIGAFGDSWATSKSLTEAGYLAGGGAGAADAGQYHSVTSGTESDNYYAGAIQPTSAMSIDAPTTKALNITGFVVIKHKTQFLIRAGKPVQTDAGDLINYPADSAWDANTADVVEDTWHKYDTTGPIVGDQTAAFIGPLGPAFTPAWCVEPVPPASSPTNSPTYAEKAKGWSVRYPTGGYGAIFEWDVVGGYEMVP